MAKKDTANTSKTDFVKPKAEELVGYLPPELAGDAEGLRSVGGLTPIYNSKEAFEGDWPPLCGYMVGVEEIEVDSENKDPEQRVRPFLRVQITTPTKATTGNRRDGYEIQDMNVGDDVFLPMSGAIRNITQIHAACAHDSSYFFGYFKVVNQQQLHGANQLTPMWVIDARIHTKGLPRKGRFVHQVRQLSQGATSTGELYDKATGELVEQNNARTVTARA